MLGHAVRTNGKPQILGIGQGLVALPTFWESINSRCVVTLGDFLVGEFFFFNWYSGGGVQLGPLSTVATKRPIVPALGDYDDGEIGGMMIGRGNRSTERKPAPVPLCPPQTPHAAQTRTWAAEVGSQQLTA
jgi:hypothetical protein